MLEVHHIIIPTVFPPYSEIPGHYLGCSRGLAFAANYRTYSCVRHLEVSLNFLLYSLVNLSKQGINVIFLLQQMGICGCCSKQWQL